MKFAVLADIHGNALALRAVLDDMDKLGISEAVNLGDHFSGPLAAGETADILAQRDFTSIRGNHDRLLVTQDANAMGLSDSAAFQQLSAAHLRWLADLPAVSRPKEGVFMCHGTPQSDETYWLERVEKGGVVRPASRAEVEIEATNITEPLILCAHTHIPRIVHLQGGRMVLNPGSIGCPAYDDDTPIYHRMQTGTPNASYAIVEQLRGAWTATFRSVPYPHAAMAALAQRNGREDWARALTTGWFDE